MYSHNIIFNTDESIICQETIDRVNRIEVEAKTYKCYNTAAELLFVLFDKSDVLAAEIEVEYHDY